MCPACDVSLSVHLHPERLLCHLCGHAEDISLECKNCHGTTLKKVGVGTQHIEESLKKSFSKATIFRFDTDSTNTKIGKQEALQRLSEADIIIGTKMLTTGFDLSDIGLIGVILLEQELSYPQYNIEEKLYTSLKQLFGRGERKGQSTDIVVQTFVPENPLVKQIIEGNYKSFFMDTLKERREFNYPPFTEMATLDYRDMSREKSLQFQTLLHNKLKTLFANEECSIILNSIPFKKNNQFHTTIILKAPNIRNILQARESEILRNSKLSVIFS